jgi:hypothetical protein
MIGATPDDAPAFPARAHGRWWFTLTVPDTVDAYPVRVSWWGEDRTSQDRFVTGLLNDAEGRPDRVLVDGQHRIVAQLSLDDLQRRSAALGHPLLDVEPVTVDVRGARQRITAWPSPSACSVVLDAWNLLVDVGRSVDRPLVVSGKGADHAYEMILWGTGILRPDEAQDWRPWLSPTARRKVHQVLTRGIHTLQLHIGAGRDDVFEKVTTAVNAEDPLGLVEIAGYYEYSLEVDDLVELGPTASPDDVLRVFDDWFEDMHGLTTDAAERIALAVRQA